MTRTRLTIVAAALLLGAVLVAAPAVAQDEGAETLNGPESDPNDTELNETDGDLNETDGDLNETENETTVSIGQRISLIVTTHQSEIESDLGDAAFRYTFERGDKPEAVRERVREIHDRILEYKRQRQELQDEWKSGNISREEYLTRKTALSIRAEDANESLGEVNGTATEGMNATERQQVNFSQVRRLQHEARNMSGPETERVARSIGGRTAALGGRPSDGGSDPGDVSDKPDDADGRPSDGDGDPGDVSDKPDDADGRPSDGDGDPSDISDKPDDSTDTDNEPSPTDTKDQPDDAGGGSDGRSGSGSGSGGDTGGSSGDASPSGGGGAPGR